MADCIPFVNSNDDCRILSRYYADARACRLSLNAVAKLKPHIPPGLALWVDPGVDAYHHMWTANPWPVDIRSVPAKDVARMWPRDEKGGEKDAWKLRLWSRWESQFKSFHSHQLLLDEKCWQKKHESDLNRFVAEVLEACLALKPAWVTVPQLPVGKGRGKINKSLALAASIWRRQKHDNTQFILPVIITSVSTLGSKPARDKALQSARDCYGTADAGGIWVVDNTLNDQARNEKFSARYEMLIEFHEALRECLPRTMIAIAGPYWGINLVLWARGLCDFPAVSLGTSYTYHVSCGQTTQGTPRLAIPPLRRWVMANEELFKWLDMALTKLNSTDSAYEDLAELQRNFTALSRRAAAADQVARFYRKWIEKIQNIEPKGRALGLYQDLSSAFVLGRQLPPLPKTTLPTSAPAKVLRAGKVAEQLMLHCL